MSVNNCITGFENNQLSNNPNATRRNTIVTSVNNEFGDVTITPQSIGAMPAGGSTSWGNISGTLSNQTDLQTALNNKQDKLPTLANNKFLHTNGSSIDWADIPDASWGSITGTLSNQTDLQSALNLKANKSNVDTIESLIPTQASVANKLADKNFVNSSIATNTANYISNDGQPFTSVAQLEAYTGTVTNNDYAFVTGVDTHGNTYFDRYKATVVGSIISWAKEYRLNNSSFTAEQWSAITSGITSGLVALINTALQPSALIPYRISSDQDVIDATKQAQNIQRTVTIAVADWNGGTTCTKEVLGVTANNTVIVDPSDASVSATAQGTDQLTFTATATPTAQVTVKVVILP